MSEKKEELAVEVGETKVGWLDKKSGKVIPYSSMSTDHLQSAKLYAQKKEIIYLNRMGIFSDQVENLEAEAAKRGIELRDYDSEFHAKRRNYKQKQEVADEK